jgi:hypothetical protein
MVYRFQENKLITYNSDVKTIKKYLNIAVEKGIVLNINLKKLKVNVDSQKNIPYSRRSFKN